MAGTCPVSFGSEFQLFGGLLKDGRCRSIAKGPPMASIEALFGVAEIRRRSSRRALPSESCWLGLATMEHKLLAKIPTRCARRRGSSSWDNFDGLARHCIYRYVPASTSPASSPRILTTPLRFPLRRHYVRHLFSQLQRARRRHAMTMVRRCVLCVNGGHGQLLSMLCLQWFFLVLSLAWRFFI